jgi:hypothetical protein
MAWLMVVSVRSARPCFVLADHEGRAGEVRLHDLAVRMPLADRSSVT